MDINRLEYFVTIARCGSLADASKQLRLSSAALSKSMSVLEQELGHDIFLRQGRGIVLSEFGIGLLPKAEAVLAASQDLMRPGPSSFPADQIRLATFEVFSTYAIVKILKDLIPQHSLQLLECLPGEIETRVAANQADIGISYVPIANGEVDHLKVGSVAMGTYSSHNFAREYDGNSWQDIPFVAPLAPPYGTPSRAVGLDGWPDSKVKRDVRHRVALMQSAIRIAQNGYAACFIPNFVAELVNEVSATAYHLHKFKAKVSQSDMQDIFIIKRRNSVETKVIKIITKGLRQLIR